MANPLQIANRTKLISERAKLVFADIQKRYEQGSIKSELELQYQVYMALENFFMEFGKPTMKARLADGAPISADYNAMLKEIYNDIKVMFAECQEMTKAISESFNQIEMDRKLLTGQMNQVQERLRAIELKMTEKPAEVIFRESFLNTELYDVDLVDGTPAAVSAAEGVLSLAKIEAEEFRDGVRVSVNAGNGFIGNTHQVRFVNGAYKFHGEDDMHMNPADIIDGNADTWMEYEAFQVTDAVRKSVGGHGFDYKEGFQWVKSGNGALTLDLIVELPVAKTINWLSLSPFLPSDKGVTPAILTSMIIQDGKGSANEVSSGYDILREDAVFIFPRQKCKRVRIKLQQPTGYETTIGHFFFKELENNEINYMAKTKEQAGRRIKGPQPSVTNLGYKYDPSTRSLIQPASTVDDRQPNQDTIKATLFSVPEVTGNVQAGLEALSAKRYVIGIRDMSISSYRFAASSIYISKPFETADAISQISLDSFTEIPKDFGEGDWVKYEISIDDGKSWNAIAPRGTSKSGSKVAYLINSNTPIEGRFDTIGYIDTMEPVRSVRLKMTLSRPLETTNADYYTPIVKEFKLRCETTKEVG